jgi:transcription antitermination factor NusG
MRWYVLHARYHHERAVYGRLLQRSFEAYLPMTRVRRTSVGARRETEVPLFPRRVFVRCFLDQYTHLSLITIPGVIRLLEDAEGRFLAVPGEEIRTIRRLLGARVYCERAPYQADGERFRVVQGPLRGITGVVRADLPEICFVPIHALKESVAFRISPGQTVPAVEDLEGASLLGPAGG